MDVLVNAAMSVDGKLSTTRRKQLTISGPEDLDRVDELRAEVDAVAVGVGTVLADDPSLTVDDPDRIEARRAADRSSQPARIVADSRGRTPLDAQVLDDRAATYILTAEVAPADRVSAYEDAGATVLGGGRHRVDLDGAFQALDASGIDSVLVEGGGEFIFSLFEAQLVDRLSVYVGSMIVGGRDAPTLADGDGFLVNFPQLTLDTMEPLDDGVLVRYAIE